MSRRPQGTELDPFVAEYEHDAQRPRASEALLSLRKIASLVKPIMRQRNWRVGVLCEFYPDQDNLLGLNINRGQKICLRLRHAGDDRQFLPIEEVVDTMLHELCHNVHGPHDEQFHALWNQLRDEHQALVHKGYTGEGFLSKGKKLGGSGRIPMHEARRKARAAAEKRKVLTANSGQKLGGAPVMRGTDIRRVIADAAQRRITVTKGCASGTDQGRKIARDVEENRNGFRTKAEEDDANERAIMQAYIDMIQEEEREKYGKDYTPPSEDNPAGPRATLSPPPSANLTYSPLANTTSASATDEASRQPIIDLIDSEGEPDDPADPDTWVCEICTLVNPIQFLSCDACTTERPSSTANGAPTATAHAPIQPHPSKTSNKPPSATRRRPNDDPRILRPRQTLSQSLAAMDAQAARKVQDRPMGWQCHVCDNWMETQWWTCARCGTMKQAS